MGIFNMAVGALMKQSNPTINRRSCWNMQPHKERCNACMDICPAGIFERAGMAKDFTNCIDCGLCVSVCKTRCIVPSEEHLQKDLHIADLEGDTIWIGCEQSQRKNSVVRTCVGSLDWEYLAYLALNKKLVLDLTPCAQCKNRVCVEHVRNVARRLLEFLGPQLFTARVTLAQKQDDAPFEVKEYDRREMMQRMTKGSRSGTKQLLRMIPGVQEQTEDRGLVHRELLHHRLKQIKEGSDVKATFGYYLPSINENCYGCGRCVRICRSGALEIREGADGISRVVVTPWKCSECGLCASSCLEKAMDGMVLRQLTTLGPVSVYKFKKNCCSECGKPMSADNHDGLCKVCYGRHKARLAREAAERRRKEQQEKQQAERAKEKLMEKTGKTEEELNQLAAQHQEKLAQQTVQEVNSAPSTAAEEN